VTRVRKVSGDDVCSFFVLTMLAVVYRVAVNLNIIGLHYVLNLCKQMTKLQVSCSVCNLVHVRKIVFVEKIN